jgi:hypothetical protein
VAVDSLVSHQRAVAQIRSGWPGLLVKRRERLIEQERFCSAADKVAENIPEDRRWSLISFPSLRVKR